MCDEIKPLTDEKMRDGLVYEAVYSAVQNGIVEVVMPLCEARPELLFRGLEDGKNIFQYAVECRQENVYSLIYGVGQRNLITTLRDNSGNCILHYAGMLSPLANKRLDRIAGAAFQMQRERQWYKEVESIVVPLSGASTLNKDGLTPPQLFTEKHKQLLEDGEKWMRIYTVPGGNNQVTGFPIFLNGKEFMVFIGSDAISLCTSATSALIFLSILTSRFAEDDFLKSLPTKMILGLSALLISITTMMVAFSSALFIMFQNKLLFTYPFIFLATIPVTLFVGMQFPLLVKIFKSTYCERVFDKKINHWI
ncbi:ankyrin repeat-containing protein [Pyrus ussuriensis x Pyrus communis]|uniref:Ankyrin repeat-containing protein n=1 Tax=Pyrus ussuriensis x Pyrus communis TaxID=2448454 RepID=A0A5N5G9R3_9ROSA|nr:ankyrin repeat-containing protein [Pyrus ussuriensis x Pyrus communis]